MEKPQERTKLQKINLILDAGGYKLMHVGVKPGQTITQDELETELLNVLVGFRNGQTRLANDDRL